MTRVDLSRQLTAIIDHLVVFRAEALLMTGAVLLLLLVRARVSVWMIRLLVSVVLLASLCMISGQTGTFFGDWIMADDLSLKMKTLLIAATLSIVWFVRRPYHGIEFYFFMLSGLTGAMVMMAGAHFLIIYLGIELTSFSAYFLTGFRLKAKSSEAMMKYLLFGGLASAVMVYGISLVYGVTGSLMITDWVDQPFSRIGLILFFAGVLFKASLTPFHLWVPNVYQEAPSDAVAFFAIVPKVAAFVLVYHMMGVLPGSSYPFAVKGLMAVALITVLWGTLAAVPQRRLKRMLAYGAIAHSGFLLPMTLMGEQGLFAFSYYASAYAIMNVGVFYVVQFHEHTESKSIRFDALAGFGRQAPVMAGAMVVFLVALIGLPPTGGFTAKLLLFTGVYHQFAQSGDYFWLIYLFIGIGTSALSLYYYFQVIVSYFLKKGDRTFAKPTALQVAVTLILAVIMLWVFIQPEILNSFVVV